MTLFEKTVRRESTTDKYDSLQEAYMKVLDEASDRHRSMWADKTKKDGKEGKLIGYWDDLNAYYDFDGVTWTYTSSRKWVNQGDTEKFKKNLKAGKWRGKLIESVNEASPSSMYNKFKKIIKADINYWTNVKGHGFGGKEGMYAMSDNKEILQRLAKDMEKTFNMKTKMEKIGNTWVVLQHDKEVTPGLKVTIKNPVFK